MHWALHVMFLDSILNGICGLVRLVIDRRIPLSGMAWLCHEGLFSFCFVEVGGTGTYIHSHE